MSERFIYRLQLTRAELLSEGPTDAEAEILQHHGRYLAEQADAGRVLLAGRTQIDSPDAYGIVILQAEDESAARELMLADPAVAGEVMQAELHPYRIAVLASNITTD